MEEDENWSKAMSGELSGRRKAVEHGMEGVGLGAGLPEGWPLLTGDKEEELYTAMFKSEEAGWRGRGMARGRGGVEREGRGQGWGREGGAGVRVLGAK